MASPDQNSVDLPILTIGGRVTQYDQQALPVGASPDTRNMKYSGIDPAGEPIVAGACTRDGMGTGYYAAPFAGNPTVNYLCTFIDSTDVCHLLSLDNLGNLRDESPCPEPPGVPTVIGSVVAASLAQSDSLLNREWIAISDPIMGFGIDIPRQWNGQFFDRVSQVGPGGGVTVEDNTSTLNISQVEQFSIAGPVISTPNNTSLVATVLLENTLLTFVGATPSTPVAIQPNLAIQVNDFVTIVGVSPAGYNGTYPVYATLLDGTGRLIGFQYLIPVAVAGPSSGGNLYTGFTMLDSGPYDTPPTGNITIAGVGVIGYNGTWPVRYIYPPTYTGGANTYPLFLQLPNDQLAASIGSGTIIQPGNIGIGLHGVSVSFVTETNYITKPSPPVYWTAGGSLQAFVGFPKGPSNIIGRIIMFTPTIIAPATSGPFFFFDGPVALAYGSFVSMTVNNNTAEGGQFDFSDAVLENATSSTYLFNLLELGEVSNFCAYSGRVFACGERNKVSNFLNLTFDGGFDQATLTIPLGWTKDPVNGAGGTLSPSPYWGGAYRIQGTGVAAAQGMITQGAAVDYLGVPIININTAYSLRVRLKAHGLVSGIVNFELYSPTAGSFGVFGVNYNHIAQTYTEFIGSLMLSQPNLPNDLLFRVYAPGLTNGGYVDIDCIEVFPTLQPYNNTLVRGSYALDPESFDQSTGYAIVGPDNGYTTKSMFNLLDGKLYIVKELGLYSTQDDGANEPASWPTPIVSATVGTASARGVGVGESWAVIAHKTGAYIFWGGEPVKITQEIQPDWDLINWDAASTIYVVVDTDNKRIHIGAPTNGAVTPNVEFVCDYSQLANSEGSVSGQDIASHPQAYYSVYNPTKVVAPGKARKWSLWDITMNCAALTIRTDGSYHLLRGNGVGNGKVYDQINTQTSDDGAAIDSYYMTAYMPQIEDEQALQLGSHRKLFKYLTGYASGSGSLNFMYYGAQNQRGLALSPLPLQSPAMWDFEKNTNFIAERGALIVGTNAPGSWFHLTKLIPTLQREIFTPVRGVS